MMSSYGVEKPNHSGQSTTSRRAIVAWGLKLAGGGALAAQPGLSIVREASAQDHDGVILIAGAAEIGASPGSAFARSPVAEAAASRGAARVQAAAALAEADSDEGAMTQSPVAFAAADPDEGAVAQSAVAVASASSQDDDGDDGGLKAPMKVIAPARGGGSRAGRAGRAGRGGGGGGGGRARGGGRAVRPGRGGGRDRAGRRGRGGVGDLPSSGIGSLQHGSLAGAFAAASAAAGLGALFQRWRTEPDLAAQSAAVDD